MQDIELINAFCTTYADCLFSDAVAHSIHFVLQLYWFLITLVKQMKPV